MRDYAKVYTSFWSSANIRTLSDDGRMLALYLMSCPHSTIAGVFRLPDGYVCEDMQWSSERVNEGFAELLANGFANRCETTKWVWIIKHFEWNPPENPNQRKAARKCIEQVPDECTWKPHCMAACGPILGIERPENTEPFSNRSETLPKPETETETETGKSKSVAPASPAPPTNPKPKPSKLARPTKHALPADFGISDAVREWAAGKGYTRLDEHLEAFRAKALANGYAYADWDAAFREAIRGDWAKLGTTGGRGAPSPATPPATPHRKRLGEGSSTDYGIPGIGTPYAARAVS